MTGSQSVKTNDLLEKILEALSLQRPTIVFPEGSVPVNVAAKVYGKDADWVRAGVIVGWLPIGIATRKGKQVTSIEEMDSRYGKISYFISPKKLYEHTGYLWSGKEN